MRFTYDNLLKSQFCFFSRYRNYAETTTTTRARVFYLVFKKLDLKGTECFLKNWNFSEDKFNFLIIHGFIMLIYFSCKNKSKQNNSVVSISFVKTFIKHRFRLLLVIND